MFYFQNCIKWIIFTVKSHQMKLRILILLLLTPLFYIDAQNKINNYLNIPGPIHLNQKEYHLAWSSHPNENYFKQEYVSPNENINKYNSMVLIDFIKGDFNLRDIVDQKIAESGK